MKTQTKILGVFLSLFLAAMPFTAMRVMAVDDTTPPSVPTNLSATLNDSNLVSLSWTASTDDVGVTGYRIMRGPSQLATTSATNYVDTSVATSTTYAYSLLAYDAAGNVSSSSPEVTITTGATSTDTTAPSAPANLMATAASSTQVNLSWTASTDNVGVTGYNIYRDNAWIASTASTTYNNMGLTASTSYTYHVRAYDAKANLSTASNSVTISTLGTGTGTDVTIPSTPTNLVGTAVSPTQINLSWTASTDNVGVNGYNVYMNNNWLGHATSTSYNVTNLTASTSYTFRIRAYDAAGNQSAWSQLITVSTLPIYTTSDDSIAPSVPGNLTIIGTTSDSVKLSWTASSDNVGVAGYSLYQDGFWMAMSPGTTYTHHVNMNEDHSYYVRAFDEAGNVSAMSNVVKTGDNAPSFDNDTVAPSVPTNLIVANVSGHSVKLTWTPSTDNVEVIGYNVYHDGEWLANIDHANSFIVNGLSAGSHTFYVRAYDMRGNTSGRSNIVSATTMGSDWNGDDDSNDDNIYQHKNNGNNGNHYGQLKNGNNGNHWGHDKQMKKQGRR